MAGAAGGAGATGLARDVEAAVGSSGKGRRLTARGCRGPESDDEPVGVIVLLLDFD